jgi:hypothetical protein
VVERDKDIPKIDKTARNGQKYVCKGFLVEGMAVKLCPFRDEGECISSYMRSCGGSVFPWCFGAVMGKLLGFIGGSSVGVANIVKVRGCRCAVACKREGKKRNDRQFVARIFQVG